MSEYKLIFDTCHVAFFEAGRRCTNSDIVQLVPPVNDFFFFFFFFQESANSEVEQYRTMCIVYEEKKSDIMSNETADSWDENEHNSEIDCWYLT